MAQTERKKEKNVAGRLSNTEKEEDSSRRKAKDRKMKSAPGGLAQRKMKKTVPGWWRWRSRRWRRVFQMDRPKTKKEKICSTQKAKDRERGRLHIEGPETVKQRPFPMEEPRTQKMRDWSGLRNQNQRQRETVRVARTKERKTRRSLPVERSKHFFLKHTWN